MKKTLLILALSGFALTACSKPTENAAEKVENTPQIQQTQANAPATTPDTTHNAETSLDWAGKYKGLFPCADCEGIETELKLNADKTYELEEEYKGGKGEGKKFESKGSFTFDNTGSIITLDQAADNRKFFVGENFIEARDRDTGAKIDSALAEHYKLNKESN
ncbi:copper homeostasis protein CutF [Acinetobacter defluvii]|uniref:copper resistance protein NlpE n=1 Tax=Acinetobacter defluvii TaxID=1871111 RepID=UPI00148F7F8E|nr:copper resistance protein NlpE [Acinetobacter defluvii]NNP73031.1 copper homeostasis protein CutF [Acinetobacter defluvii]